MDFEDDAYFKSSNDAPTGQGSGARGVSGSSGGRRAPAQIQSFSLGRPQSLQKSSAEREPKRNNITVKNKLLSNEVKKQGGGLKKKPSIQLSSLDSANIALLHEMSSKRRILKNGTSGAGKTDEASKVDSLVPKVHGGNLSSAKHLKETSKSNVDFINSKQLENQLSSEQYRQQSSSKTRNNNAKHKSSE